MSTKKQSKRARFYALQSKSRKMRRIIRLNMDNPRFLGAISSMTITFGNGERRSFGFGALMIGKEN